VIAFSKLRTPVSLLSQNTVALLYETLHSGLLSAREVVNLLSLLVMPEVSVHDLLFINDWIEIGKIVSSEMVQVKSLLESTSVIASWAGVVVRSIGYV